MSSRHLAWTADKWNDYMYWQTQDRKTLRRINSLMDDTQRDDPFEGIGKPEQLKHALAGAWSRRIDEVNRCVYLVGDHYGNHHPSALTLLTIHPRFVNFRPFEVASQRTGDNYQQPKR